MIEEIVLREDNMGKLMAFLGGCVAGVVGVFAVAVMSDQSSSGDGEESASEYEYSCNEQLPLTVCEDKMRRDS